MSNAAQIILDWLNEDLSLIPEITDIKKSFFTGYLFGKIFQILNLISDEEFSEFIDSEKEADINSNFILVEKYCKKLFNLILFEKEINRIKKQHKSAAGVLLYKIRNGVYKLKINFNNIEFFGSNFSNDEIAEQINDLIQKQLGDNVEENEKSETNESLLEQKDRVNFNDKNNIKEEKGENYDNNNYKHKTFAKKIETNLNKKFSRVSKILPAISTMRGFNKFEFKKTNYENNNNLNNRQIPISKSKTVLAPLNHFAMKRKSNSTENIFIKDKTRNLFNSSTNTLPLKDINKYDTSTFYSGTFFTGKNYDSQLIDVRFFNKQLDQLGVTKKDYKINEIDAKKNISTNAFNFNNTLLQKTTNKTINNETITNPGAFNTMSTHSLLNMKTAEEISNELKNKLRPKKLELKNEVKDKNINFIKINKNFFNINQMKLYFKEHSNFSTIRRMNYSKELSVRNEQQVHEKRLLDNELMLQKINQGTLPQLYTTKSIDNNNSISNNLTTLKLLKRNSIREFNSKTFFQYLSYQTYSSFKSQCQKKYEKKRKISNKIKEIILFIIDMAMEGYIYQTKHKSEIMDLETFLKFNIYFLKNKRLRKKYIPVEELLYKRSGKIEQDIEIENLYNNNLTNEDKNYIEDYIYYIGVWNDDKIYDKSLRGIKLDYKYITNDNVHKENIGNNFNNNNYFGIVEYEPTALESEDLSLPNTVPDNYNLGNLLLEILSNRFNSDNKNNINNAQNLTQANDINNPPCLNGKWDYIPYKISLVGYPLSGRKTVAKKIANIYPNLKIYQMQRIINYFFNLYLQLADPVEKPEEKNDKKKGKKNEKSKENEKVKEKTVKITDKDKESVFEKYERQQKFKELKPVFDSMKSYIDYKLNNNTTSNNNTSMNNSSINNKGDFIILPDESLCLLLVKKIEEDFPALTQKKIIKNLIDKQKSIKDLENQIEQIKKRKEEAKKPNPKDDTLIEKYENDIKNIKAKSIWGFILVDYPTNLNQCLLLENYLTGFIEEKRQQKSDKDKIISNTNSIVDYKYQPREKKMDKKSGLNFIVHISTKESIVDERFETAKYDPIEKVLYTGKNIVINDKAIKERLVNKIPYLSKERFEYYKDEYNNNINKIISLYSEFGFIIKCKKDEFDFLEPKKGEKMIKTFYYIESENIKDFLSLNNKKNKNKKNKKKEEKKEEKKEGEVKQEASEDNNNIIKDKVLNFITNNLIEKLHQENEQYEEEQFQVEFPKYNNKKANEKTTITFEPDLNINEIKSKYKNKSAKKLNGNLKLIDYDNNKIDIIIKNLSLINNKYYKNIGIFIHLMNSQKNDIYERLNLIQTEFRDFLNKKNPKKRIIITNYINKYNSLYIRNPEYLRNEQVISQLTSDIEDLRTEVWELINKKRNDSIEELNEIKHCSFIEVELIKFYNNVKNLILNEVEKFLVIFNNMLLIYNKIKDKENRDINILINEFNSKLITNPEFILKNIKDFKYHFNSKGDVKLDMPLEEVINIILSNIEIMFKNSIKMLFEYHNQLSNIFRRVKKSIFANVSIIKKSVRIRKKKRKNSEKKLFSASMMNDLLTNKDSDTGYLQEKNIKKIFIDEKNKFKFRLCFIKNFATKYIQIMKSTAEKVFDNMDEWIIKNVTLQSESISYLIKILKNFLFQEKKLIDQESDIDYIELDEFEKIIEDIGDNNNKKLTRNTRNFNSSNISGSRIGTSGNLNGSGMIASTENDLKLKPFDNSSVVNNRIYNKINLNFLIKDNFIETKIEEIYDQENIKKNIKPKIRIIPPPTLYNSSNTEFNYGNNSSSEFKGEQSLILNTKTFKGKNNNLNEADFYFDIEKFKFLYRNIKKYEVEDGCINKEVFFEIFIRQYLIAKKNYGIKKRKNSDDSDDSYNKNMNVNINYFYNEEINVETNKIIFNNNTNAFPVICKALKKLSMKQIKRLYNCFGINIIQFNYIKPKSAKDSKKEKKEVKKDNENKDEKEIKIDKRSDLKKPSRRKITRHKANDSKQLSSSKSKDKTDNKSTQDGTKMKKNQTKNNISKINSTIEEEEKKETIEYNTYLSTKEIFTMIPLIGVNILTPEIEEKIEKEIKDKLIMEKYLTKKDFLECHFWFEPFFEYYIYDKIDEKEGITGSKMIKEFLFELWKNDENSTYFDFNKFFDVLRINKYVTDLIDFNEIKYYDIIFF